jgi:hypothetical protein
MYAVDRIHEMNEDGVLMYNSSSQEVHLDEKWFFLTEKEQALYIAEQEEPPQRHSKNKNHRTKVMFLAAVARPRFDEDGNCIFDGKIGTWPFIVRTAAQRTSVNRVRGTMETKSINVDYDTYLNYVLEFVMPAIKQQFPRNHSRQLHVGIQHDNAPVHFDKMDNAWVDFVQHPENRHWGFHIKEQPPNSPDTNVLDLGFFTSIQAMQWLQEPATTG